MTTVSISDHNRQSSYTNIVFLSRRNLITIAVRQDLVIIIPMSYQYQLFFIRQSRFENLRLFSYTYQLVKCIIYVSGITLFRCVCVSDDERKKTIVNRGTKSYKKVITIIYYTVGASRVAIPVKVSRVDEVSAQFYNIMYINDNIRIVDSVHYKNDDCCCIAFV